MTAKALVLARRGSIQISYVVVTTNSASLLCSASEQHCSACTLVPCSAVYRAQKALCWPLKIWADIGTTETRASYTQFMAPHVPRLSNCMQTKKNESASSRYQIPLAAPDACCDTYNKVL
eukprot:6185147-Pleurochrysis_carterae.AAC.1